MTPTQEGLPALAPCPFCGGEAKLIHDTSSDYEAHWSYRVSCSTDDCVEGSYFATPAEAIAAWSRRPSVSAGLASDEAVRAEWQRILDKDDRNSPAEYPEMAMITFEEFREALNAAAPFAGEPVVKPLEWRETTALGGRTKLIALDVFGNEFMRVDDPGSEPNARIEALKASAQARYERSIRSALAHPAEQEPGWRDIRTAPKDDRDILVGGWVDGEWCCQISSREDRPFRRGYRHRNGAEWATVWHPLPSPATPVRDGTADAFDVVAHLTRQRAWSCKTFGPGPRTQGVLDHIRKELGEIEADPSDIMEWVDVIILAFDGAWRAGWEPEAIVAAWRAKQAKNEARDWPDWRTAAPDKAIEHVREPVVGTADAGETVELPACFENHHKYVGKCPYCHTKLPGIDAGETGK